MTIRINHISSYCLQLKQIRNHISDLPKTLLYSSQNNIKPMACTSLVV